MKLIINLNFLLLFTVSYCFIHQPSLNPLSDANRYTKLLLHSKNELNENKFAVQFAKRINPNIIGRIVTTLICSVYLLGSGQAFADDELAQFAAEGNKVGVDASCFIKKCALESSRCMNDPSCVKGLSCLARCKGGSMCSTGCFAKYGSDKLDSLLHCSVEKNDCVSVPGKESNGWVQDRLVDLPTKPLSSFDVTSLKGNWYKVMGLDSRYDCFDCQRNSFEISQNKVKMEALFRIPRPSKPGYLQNKISEELHPTSDVERNQNHEISHLKSNGQMFGLTFWENWYVLAEYDPLRMNQINELAQSFLPKIGISRVTASNEKEPQPSEMKLIYYTGHTLQGSYKGAFLYSRRSFLTPDQMKIAYEVIRKGGLNPNDFCVVRNQCFLSKSESDRTASSTPNNNALTGVQLSDDDNGTPFWYLGQKFFQVTGLIANELADWFEDPAIVSDWLVKQQQRMVFDQPLAVSPFASLPESYSDLER